MVPILAVSRYLVHVFSELLEAITDRHVTSILIHIPEPFLVYQHQIIGTPRPNFFSMPYSYGLTKDGDSEENIEIYFPKKNHIFYEGFFWENKSSYFLIQKIHAINLYIPILM